MPKTQETILEIDLGSLKHNFNYLRSKLNPGVKFMAVVKAFAYGSDANVIASFLENNGVDYFAVAYVHEGVSLRNSGITKPILVLHPQVSNFKELIDRCIEPNLYSFDTLKQFISYAEGLDQKNYPVHIKFNTGLNRLGFNATDISEITSVLNVTSAIKVRSVFSHLAASEDQNENAFTLGQIGSFDTISNQFEKSIGYMIKRHICNTSGTLNFPNAHYDFVRCGIGLYGFGNSETENKNLKPIARLKSVISQIHHLHDGDTLGYNRAFKSNREMRTATIPIGHADGIGRQYGNGIGYVYIGGQKAAILGNVCMDMIMVNVSDIACKEGDEVIIFDEFHTAETLASATQSISYELITSVSQRIKRIFIDAS